MKYLAYILFGAMVLAGCKKDEDVPGNANIYSTPAPALYTHSLVPTADGNIVFCANAAGKVFITKVTPQCNVVWIKQYYIGGMSHITAEGADGSLYVGCNFGNNYNGFIKLSPQGDSLAAASYQGLYNGIVTAVTQTSTSDILVGAETVNGIQVMKFTATGQWVWYRHYDNTLALDKTISDIIELPNGNFLLSSTKVGVYYVEIDNQGSIVRQTDISQGAMPSVRKTMLLPNGNLLTLGSANVNNNSQAFILLCTTQGQKIKQVSYGHAVNAERVFSACTTAGGNYLISGISGNSINDGILLCVDENLDSLWCNYLGSKNSIAYNLLLPATDGYVIAGHYYKDDIPYMFTTRINNNGQFLP